MRSILFVTHSADLSEGMTRRIFNTARILKKNRYRVIGLFEKRAPGGDRLSEAFDETHYLDTTGMEGLKKLKERSAGVAFIHEVEEPRLLRTLLAEKFKLITFVHNHDWCCPTRYKTYGLIGGNCTLPFSPAACTLCSLFSRTKKKRPIRRQQALMTLIKRSRQFLVMSEFMAAQLRSNGFKQKRIVKLYPPVVGDGSPRDSGSRNDDIPEILFVGRLIAAKGPDLLLEAARRIDRPFRLRLVGTGPLEHSLRRMTARYRLDDRVFFEGAAENPDLFLERAAIVAVPSRWPEPFAMIGIEAFAHSLPVVAFTGGGVGEWLIHNYNGLLAKPNDPDDLATCLTALLDDPAKREQCGRNGHAFVDAHCTETRFLAQFDRIYDDVHVADKVTSQIS